MKIIQIIFLACLVLCFTTCNDFLETKSKSNFSEEVVFDNVDYASKVLYSCYNLLLSSELWSYEGYWFMMDTDVEASFTVDEGARHQSSHYTAHPGMPVINALWVRLYSIIEQVNMIIDNLPDGPLWTGQYEREAKRIYGEAITLRAYCYYFLIGYFGDVPFLQKSTKATDNLYVPKTPRDEVYEQLIQELAEVQDYVPWSFDAGTNKRVSKGFIKGLRAKMALMYAGYSLRGRSEQHITRTGPKRQEYYQIARQECLEVMNSGRHRLKPDWVSIFKDLHEYKMDLDYGETIFETAAGRLISGRLANSIGMPFSTSPAEPKYGRAAAEVRFTMHYYYSFDKNDNRRDVTSELYNYANNSTYLGMQRLIPATGTDFAPCKWRRTWIVPSMGGDLAGIGNTGICFPMLRFTDLVLLFAETENELNGPTQAAKDALISVRQRVFDQELWDVKVRHYVDSVAENKEKFFNALVDERAWEFGGEYVRKFDLIRWNLLGAKKDYIMEAADNIINRPEDPPYNFVPYELFWRESSDNPEFLEILNPDYRYPLNTIMPGWTSTAWLSGMTQNQKDIFFGPSQYSLYYLMRGYKKERNNYLFPIPEPVVNASRGTIENDHWYPWEQNSEY